MGKKSVKMGIILLILIAVSLVLVVLIISNKTGLSFDVISGGGVLLYIEPIVNITILSPLNETYIYNLSDGIYNRNGNFYSFMIDLNVSSNLDADVETWMYSLYLDDVLYDGYVDFFPNQSISVRMGQNTIIVYARTPLGRTYEKNVSFFIELDQSAPILTVEDKYFFCGDSYSTGNFSVVDYDNNLESIDVLPRDIIFGKVSESLSIPGKYNGEFFTSGKISNSFAGTYQKTVYAIDETELMDYKSVNFTILRTNSVPEVENLTVYKIWTNGLTTKFNLMWHVADFEDGLSSDGNMIYTIMNKDGTPFNLFGINNYGEMNYVANDGSPRGVFLLTLCVEDNALPESLISPDLAKYCGENASKSNKRCGDFALTISDENRVPKIKQAIPSLDNSSFIFMIGEISQTFFVNFSDDDNDALSVSWLVNNKTNQSKIYYEKDVYNYLDNFTYSFECGVSDLNNITVIISDGINSVNYTWKIMVAGVLCPSPREGGGGGGAGCYELWTCLDWSTCQSVQESYNLGYIELDDYYSYLDKCGQIGFNSDSCGYHIRSCSDAHNCSNMVFKVNKSTEFELCQYVSDPSCSDGIKNCHHNSCEIGIDCGGSCGNCPSCSDGKKNQGEDGIDCGGPCPNACVVETPKLNNWIIIVLSIVFLMLIVLGARILIIIIKRRNNEREKNRTSRLMMAMGDR